MEKRKKGFTLRATEQFSDSSRSDTYVLCVTPCLGQAEGDIIAASGSDKVIRTYSTDDLQIRDQITGEYTGSEGTITSLVLSGQSIWAASTDGKIRCWDIRKMDRKASNVLQGYGNEPFNCISMSTTGNLLVGGTDKVGDDASVYIWDIRMGREVLSQFTQSHSDDITQVAFNSPTIFVSGSTDGLVCLFDLTIMEEEESILSVKNSESSVARAGFFGTDLENVYCLTHQESFHSWSNTEAEPLSTQTNIKKEMKDEYSVEVDYLVDCFYQQSTEELFLVAGDRSGGIRIILTEEKSMYPFALLSGGHSAIVRTMSWHEKGNTIVTGGEDGLICLWTKDQEK